MVGGIQKRTSHGLIQSRSKYNNRRRASSHGWFGAPQHKNFQAQLIFSGCWKTHHVILEVEFLVPPPFRPIALQSFLSVLNVLIMWVSRNSFIPPKTPLISFADRLQQRCREMSFEFSQNTLQNFLVSLYHPNY